MPKPAANKPVATKPAQKTSQPKKQVANQVVKKETKPVVNATPKQNEKRKREENGSTPVHDVDKKMKEAPESVATTVGKKILLTNVPETAQLSDISALFSDLPEKPFIRIYTFRNKERVGHVMLTFRNDDSYNQAISLTNLSIHGHSITPVLDHTCEESRSVFIPFFPGAFDESDIRQFFEGLEITKIFYFTTPHGKVSGKILIEFADEESKQAAIGKSKTTYNEQNVLVYPMVLNREPKPKTLRQKTKKAPANKTQATEKVQKAVPKNPNQAKTAPAKKPNQAKTAPAKNPNQTKTSPAKKPNQPAQGKKTPAAKPNAKSAKPQANGKPKAQKKN